MYCKHCNSYVEETSKFCQECGNDIQFEKKESLVINSKNGRVNYTFIVMLILLLILIGLFIMLFIKAKKSREEIINNPNKVKEILNIDREDIEYAIE